MNLYIYSDESGVFDKEHNDIYVYGGLLFLSKEEKDINIRKYRHVEKIIRSSNCYKKNDELKACKLTNGEKTKIYRSLNNCIKFGVVVNQKEIKSEIFENKKSKQRYLDYAYKIGLKRMFEKLISKGIINPNDINNIYVYVDEHTTATDGRYELREALEQEFKIGTFNYDYNKFYPPIFKNMNSVTVDLCNSNSVTLIRGADIVANNIYYKAVNNKENTSKNLYLTELP